MKHDTAIFRVKKFKSKIALIIEGVGLYFWGKLLIDTNGKINTNLEIIEQKYLFLGITLLLMISIMITLYNLFTAGDLILTNMSIINQNAKNGITHIDWRDINNIKTTDYNSKLLLYINTDFDVKYFSDISSRRKLNVLRKNTEKYQTPFVIELDRFLADNYDIAMTIKNFYRHYNTTQNVFFSLDFD